MRRQVYKLGDFHPTIRWCRSSEDFEWGWSWNPLILKDLDLSPVFYLPSWSFDNNFLSSQEWSPEEGSRTREQSLKEGDNGKYLNFNTFATSGLGLVRIRNSCLAWLKLTRSLNLSPPWDIGRHKVSHALRCIFLFLSSPPKKYHTMSFSIFLQSPSDSLKMLIEYVGNARATNLTKISRHAWEKRRPFHWVRLVSTLSRMEWKVSFFLRLI